MRAMVIGRFQPIHRGHLAVIQEAMGWADELLVGVAAAGDSGTPENPFSAGERSTMISMALREAGIEDFRIVNLPDIRNYAVWARYVINLSPPFDVLVAHNPTTLDLFRREGVEVREATPYDIETYSGTRVRALMAEGGDWEALVPPSVAEFLRDIDGPARVSQRV